MLCLWHGLVRTRVPTRRRVYGLQEVVASSIAVSGRLRPSKRDFARCEGLHTGESKAGAMLCMHECTASDALLATYITRRRRLSDECWVACHPRNMPSAQVTARTLICLQKASAGAAIESHLAALPAAVPLACEVAAHLRLPNSCFLHVQWLARLSSKTSCLCKKQMQGRGRVRLFAEARASNSAQ